MPSGRTLPAGDGPGIPLGGAGRLGGAGECGGRRVFCRR